VIFLPPQDLTHTSFVFLELAYRLQLQFTYERIEMLALSHYVHLNPVRLRAYKEKQKRDRLNT
jgi:hypothetical protein